MSTENVMGKKAIGVILLILLTNVVSIGQGQRKFKMALWDYSGGNDADLPIFDEGNAQPPERAILLLSSWGKQQFADYWFQVLAVQYELERIDAVLIDEPFWSQLGTPDWSNPCRDSRRFKLDELRLQLRGVSEAIKATSPHMRLWINFSEPELKWMMDEQCRADLNAEYLDVISLDVYWKSFAKGPQKYYIWLLSHSFANQQIALVPGTFFREHFDDPVAQASLLSGFFDFANNLNSACDPETEARRGARHCPVWIVAGWRASSFTDSFGTLWRGETDPASLPIRTAWRSELKRRRSRH